MQIKNIPTKDKAHETLENFKKNSDDKAFAKARVVDQGDGKFAITTQE